MVNKPNDCIVINISELEDSILREIFEILPNHYDDKRELAHDGTIDKITAQVMALFRKALNDRQTESDRTSQEYGIKIRRSTLKQVGRWLRQQKTGVTFGDSSFTVRIYPHQLKDFNEGYMP